MEAPEICLEASKLCLGRAPFKENSLTQGLGSQMQRLEFSILGGRPWLGPQIPAGAMGPQVAVSLPLLVSEHGTIRPFIYLQLGPNEELERALSALE